MNNIKSRGPRMLVLWTRQILLSKPTHVFSTDRFNTHLLILIHTCFSLFVSLLSCLSVVVSGCQCFVMFLSVSSCFSVFFGDCQSFVMFLSVSQFCQSFVMFLSVCW